MITENLKKDNTKLLEVKCIWIKGDYGSFGIPSIEYNTSCGKIYDADVIQPENYCPNCGLEIKN